MKFIIKFIQVKCSKLLLQYKFPTVTKHSLYSEQSFSRKRLASESELNFV